MIPASVSTPTEIMPIAEKMYIAVILASSGMVYSILYPKIGYFGIVANVLN